jgi:hypothetical protein
MGELHFNYIIDVLDVHSRVNTEHRNNARMLWFENWDEHQNYMQTVRPRGTRKKSIKTYYRWTNPSHVSTW